MLRRWLIISRVKWLDRNFLNRKTFFEAMFQFGQAQKAQAAIMVELVKRLETLEGELAEEKRKNEALRNSIGEVLQGVRRR